MKKFLADWSNDDAIVQPKTKPSAEDRAQFELVKRGVPLSDLDLLMRGHSTQSGKIRLKHDGPRIFKSEPDFILMCAANGWTCLFCRRPYGEWYGTGTHAEKLAPEHMHALKPKAVGGTHEDDLNGCQFCNKNQNVQQGFATVEDAQAASVELWKRLEANGLRRCEAPKFID